MLDKVKNFKGYFDTLPRDFYYLYLFVDNVSSVEFPLPQPPIYLRKRIISSIFPEVKIIFLGKRKVWFVRIAKNI